MSLFTFKILAPRIYLVPLPCIYVKKTFFEHVKLGPAQKLQWWVGGTEKFWILQNLFCISFKLSTFYISFGKMVKNLSLQNSYSWQFVVYLYVCSINVSFINNYVVKFYLIILFIINDVHHFSGSMVYCLMHYKDKSGF